MQEKQRIRNIAYVIMSSHIHLIARQQKGKLNEWTRDFKSFTAKKLFGAIAKNEIESRREWMLYLFKYLQMVLSKTKKICFGKRPHILLK